MLLQTLLQAMWVSSSQRVPSGSTGVLSLLLWYFLLSLHAGSLLWGDPRRRLARQSVHGPKKLVCNAPGFSQSAQQSTMNSGGVVANCVFSRKKQARNRLGKQRTNTAVKACSCSSRFCSKQTLRRMLEVLQIKQRRKTWSIIGCRE